MLRLMRYHGYNVIDFRDVNRDYGTLEVFKALIAKAHEASARAPV